jgi:hypothetical protein
MERAADPAAFAAGERRRRIRSFVILALSLAAFAGAWGLIICRV